MEVELVEFIFTYHPPSPEQRATYDGLTAEFLRLALHVNAALPEGPGKTVAIRKLAEARMAANAAVALAGRF